MVPGQEREAKFHVVPSFLNPDWQEETVINPSFPRDIYCLLVHLNLCPEKLACHLLGRAPKIWLCRTVGYIPFVARVLLTAVSSQQNFLSFFLLVIFGSNSGSWEGSSFCILFGDVSSSLTGNFAICSDWNLTRYSKAFFFFFFFKSPYGQKLAKLETDIWSLVGTFLQAKLE